MKDKPRPKSQAMAASRRRRSFPLSLFDFMLGADASESDAVMESTVQIAQHSQTLRRSSLSPDLSLKRTMAHEAKEKAIVSDRNDGFEVKLEPILEEPGIHTQPGDVMPSTKREASVSASTYELAMYNEYGVLIDEKLKNAMDEEKRCYPGSTTWAKDEEKLFELLYLRQELPMLPKHWEFDFRGIPVSQGCFRSQNANNTVIYAHMKEFRATMALTRLIDLTVNIRTTCQCGLRNKAPKMLKKGVQSFLNWAAEDGGFSHLKVVPNIIVEAVNAKDAETSITRIIENRMRALARLQREFLKIERDVEFEAEETTESADGSKKGKGRLKKQSWKTLASRLRTRFFRLFEKNSRAALKSEGQHEEKNREERCELAGTSALDDDMKLVKVEAELRGRPNGNIPSPEDVMVKIKKEDDGDQLPSTKILNIKEEDQDLERMAIVPPIPAKPSAKTKSPVSPDSPAPRGSSPSIYRRTPPVVYGLFIVRTSIFIMSVDSSKDESAYVSFHVDLDMKDWHQSVWNALTLAMVVCMARDDMMTRLEDFEEIEVVDDDPDA